MRMFGYVTSSICQSEVSRFTILGERWGMFPKVFPEIVISTAPGHAFGRW